eukprot:355744-Chlamydomonas_euryale.AAC.1
MGVGRRPGVRRGRPRGACRSRGTSPCCEGGGRKYGTGWCRCQQVERQKQQSTNSWMEERGGGEEMGRQVERKNSVESQPGGHSPRGGGEQPRVGATHRCGSRDSLARSAARNSPRCGQPADVTRTSAATQLWPLFCSFCDATCGGAKVCTEVWTRAHAMVWRACRASREGVDTRVGCEVGCGVKRGEPGNTKAIGRVMFFFGGGGCRGLAYKRPCGIEGQPHACACMRAGTAVSSALGVLRTKNKGLATGTPGCKSAQRPTRGRKAANCSAG